MGEDVWIWKQRPGCETGSYRKRKETCDDSLEGLFVKRVNVVGKNEAVRFTMAGAKARAPLLYKHQL